MTVKLFQDAGGTIPAVLAGQPVGFIKRTKGSDDAKQATALSKPTLGRHPWTGVRNLAMGAQAVGSPLFWVAETKTQSGITIQKLGFGLDEDGFEYVEYALSGTATANAFMALSVERAIRSYGDFLSARLEAKLVSGSTHGPSDGIRFIVQRIDGAEINLGSGVSSSLLRGDTTDYRKLEVSVSRTSVPDAASQATKVEVRYSQGAVADQVWRVRMVQAADSQPPFGAFQRNYGPNDVIESGVPDLWHLYNDGGDSLNVTLPAGTYGLASIGIDRQIVIGTITSDGTTPVNILRHERQLDVSYRLGAYSAAEELAIRDAWGRKYA